MEKSTEDLARIFLNGKQDLGNMLEGYVYLRWPALYIYHLRNLVPDPSLKLRRPDGVLPELEEMIRLIAERTLPTIMSPETSTYHGKVLKLDEASALIKIDHDVSLTGLEKVIPYKHARDLILNSPGRIALLPCPCRESKEKPCEPLDVCMWIGEPFVSFILEHKTKGARQISQDEALDILKAEDDRGHIHTAWFKDALGGRYYCMCNCCKCCCTAMRGHNIFGVPVLASSGYVARISDECNACGECVDFCQFGALKLDGEVHIVAEKCMGCGVCESKCSRKAISLERDHSRGEPLDVRLLVPQG